jgi:hypothetical protein
MTSDKDESWLIIDDQYALIYEDDADTNEVEYKMLSSCLEQNVKYESIQRITREEILNLSLIHI